MPALSYIESVKRLKIHKTSLQPLDNSGVIPNIDALTIVHGNITMVYQVTSISANTADTYLLEVKPSSSIKPASTSNALTIFIPYSDSKFSVSDYNALYGNYSENRTSNLFMESDYNTGTLHPNNFIQILDLTATKAQVQDSNYTGIGSANARYYGSRNMSPDFNITSPFTTEGEQFVTDPRVAVGLKPAVEQTNPYMLVFDRINSTYNEYNGGLAAKIAFIIDEDSNIITPNKGREGLNIISQGFPATSEIDIELSDNTLFGVNMAGINGRYNVKYSAQAPSTYLYTHTGSLGGYERLDELVFDDPNPIGAGYNSPDLADPNTTTATTTYTRANNDAEVEKGHIFTGAVLFDSTSVPYNYAFTTSGTHKGIFTTEVEVTGEGRASMFSLYDKIEARLIREEASGTKHTLDSEIHKFPEKDPETYTFRLQSLPIDVVAGEKVYVELEVLEDFKSINVSPKVFELRSSVPVGSKKVLYYDGSINNISVSDISTNITNGVDGTYNEVPLQGGSGSGATASFTVSNGAVTMVSLDYRGFGYSPGDTVFVAADTLGSGSSFVNIPLTSSTVKTEKYFWYWTSNEFSMNSNTLLKNVGRFYQGPYNEDTLDEDKDFDDIAFPLEPQVGDFVRFNNDQTTARKIVEIKNAPATSFTIFGITITLPKTTIYVTDEDIIGADPTNDYAGPQAVTFTRMVEEPVIIVDGYKPDGQTSRGLIKPEYMSDKLKDNFSKIVGDLKEKNLI